MTTVTKGGQGARTYGEQNLGIPRVLMCTCLHSEAVGTDTCCIRFQITCVRSTQLVLVNFCKFKWFHPIYPVTRSKVATVINIEKLYIERSQW